MAEKACHAFGSTTRFGLTQVLGIEMRFLASLQASDWIAISSVVVALCAMGISIWQGILAREHAHLSSKPIIEANFNPNGGVGIDIYNAGLGPAVLTNFTAVYLKQEFDMFRGSEQERLLHAIVAHRSYLPQISISYRVPSRNSTVAASEVVNILRVTSEWETVLDSVRSAFSDIELKLTYQDIYGTAYSCHHVSGLNA